MQTVEQFINALGGTVDVSIALDLAPSTVSSWKTSGSVPRWRMDALRKLAKKRGVEVPDLASRPTPAQDAAA